LFLKRLGKRLREFALDSRPLRRYRALALRAIAEKLQHGIFRPSGSEGYRAAEGRTGRGEYRSAFIGDDGLEKTAGPAPTSKSVAVLWTGPSLLRDP